MVTYNIDVTVTDPILQNVSVAVSELGGLTVTPWTAVTFQNSWENFADSRQATQYRKVGDEVRLRGEIKNGTTGTVAFTLPVGFHPPTDIVIPIGSFNTAPVEGVMLVSTTGTVTIYVTSTTSVFVIGSFSITP